ncbi:MAG: hydroxyethylthiazole kinase [Candidatus Omnitrophota bacterium]|nr:hydroxyethylthiazole kinase [Candidatus Omnitrophota bacterium]MBU1928643.1 hydroxyethylthiazole kinase [Candidatus Omnitrophota bacterium]MBU2034739.1 hydroxyethylthiazole kinase [Candidatus Omnitrophota bacterium]MBU2222085.1 hydroxyethylthiazole kinase [Candidatus Omnitrophota bacterium]
MKKVRLNVFSLLEKVRSRKPVIHHLTNWVTIYDCANVVKVFGASPVMAHAPEEAAQMSAISSALVLNIGTLTKDLVTAMMIAAKSANQKGIPVILDACGAGATALRTDSCLDLINNRRIDIIKGNASEIACLAGEKVMTKGVDSSEVGSDLKKIASKLALKRKCTVVITGKEDIVNNGHKSYIIRNGHPMMDKIVGTGCMAASVIGTFAAVEKDLSFAAASGLVCFEIAAELAVKKALGPGTFKEKIYDCIYNLDEKTLNGMQKVYQ